MTRLSPLQCQLRVGLAAVLVQSESWSKIQLQTDNHIEPTERANGKPHHAHYFVLVHKRVVLGRTNTITSETSKLMLDSATEFMNRNTCIFSCTCRLLAAY